MSAVPHTRIRQVATAVAVVGAVIGLVAIVRSATSEDAAVGVPPTADAASSSVASTAESSQVDALNDELAAQVGPAISLDASSSQSDAVAVDGTGLDVEFFGTRSFTGDVVAGSESSLDLSWADDPPVAGVPSSDFSARWRGQITSGESGDHRFFITATGRVSLRVNGYELVRGWQDDPTAERSGTTYLTAGEPVDIYVEFSSDPQGQDQSLRLEWEGPEGSREPVPIEALSPLDATGTRDVHVAPDGDVDGDGTVDRPLPLQRAADLARPGDTILLASGTYTMDDPDKGAVLTVDRSGSPDRPVTFAPAPGAAPVLQSNAARIIELRGASYISVSGLVGVGPSASVTMEEALTQFDLDEEGNFSYTATGASLGILVNPRFDATDVAAHHVDVSANTITEVSGCGICAFEADHLRIIANSVSGTGAWHPSNYSGISLQGARNTGSERGTNIVISGNVLTGNENRVVNSYSNSDPNQRFITGGGGIAIHDISKDPSDGSPVYVGKTVVVNNVITDNGGFAVSVRGSNDVELINNTMVANATSTSSFLTGEIEIERATGTVVSNNVIVPTAERGTFRNIDDEAVASTGNLVAPGAIDAADLVEGFVVAEPSFTDASGGDFTLSATSAAIDIGDASRAPATGIDGVPRPSGAGVDAGAYEAP